MYPYIPYPTAKAGGETETKGPLYLLFHIAMCNQDTFKIDLKGMKEQKAVREYDLDDAYFEAVDGPEVRAGHVHARVEIARSERFFELGFTIEGTVTVPCDVCLDDMSQPVSTSSSLVATLGTEPSEEDSDVVTVDETEGILDISWTLYELIALAIPTRHVHAEGQCNPDMLRAIAAHTAGSGAEDHAVDPRWGGLEKLKQ